MLAMVKVAVRTPALVGCTCTLMVLARFGAMVKGKVGAPTTLKSLAWGPLKLRPITVTLPVPVF